MQLMTLEIAAALKKATAEGEKPPEQTPIVVKYFLPGSAATWWVTEGERLEDGDWRLFGFCDLGDRQMAELGYVMLSDITNVRGGLGLPVERDLYYEGTLAEVLKEYGKLRS